MALTLIEAAKIALGRDEVLKATVMELYAKNSDVLQFMPFEDISGNALAFNREKTLPAIGFRGLNEAFAEGTGEVENITESLAIAGGDLDVDKFLVDTGGANQRAAQEGMKIKALSLSMTQTVMKGSVLTTPKGFDGLQVRCTGDQLISNSSVASGAGLSLARLDELIDAVEEPTNLIMNKGLRRRLTQAARTTTVGGMVTYDTDAFGRRITRYNDLTILIADKDNTNTDILPFTEAAASGSSVDCSIYCVSFADNGVVGLQNQEMQVRDLGEQDSKPVYRTRIEWYITMAILRPRAAARLRYIQDAAATA
jgi:hypothetical protein